MIGEFRNFAHREVLLNRTQSLEVVHVSVIRQKVGDAPTALGPKDRGIRNYRDALRNKLCPVSEN